MLLGCGSRTDDVTRARGYDARSLGRAYRGREVTEKELVEKTVSIPHVRVTGYRTEYANGCAGTGPLEDDLFRLTFFRDAIPPITEVFGVSDTDPDEIDLAKQHPVQVQIVREDLITLLATPEVVRKMGLSLLQMAEAAERSRG